MAAESFGAAVLCDGDTTLVRVRGELDAVTVATLEQRMAALLTRGHGPVLLDLRELEFIDVAGLRLTLRLDGLAQLNGVRFALVRGLPHVRRVFELTGMERFVPAVDDPRELAPA
jgi:anti-sigma B factor antagonist